MTGQGMMELGGGGPSGAEKRKRGADGGFQPAKKGKRNHPHKLPVRESAEGFIRRITRINRDSIR